MTNQLPGGELATENEQAQEETGVPTNASLEPAFVPEGWKTYSSDIWREESRQRRIAFAYPSHWTLEERRDEQYNEDQKLTTVILEGDEHRIQIDQSARGHGRPYDSETTIGGYSARTWQSELGDGYVITLGVVDANFVVRITTPDKTKKLSDKILSTVVFAR